MRPVPAGKRFAGEAQQSGLKIVLRNASCHLHFMERFDALWGYGEVRIAVAILYLKR